MPLQWYFCRRCNHTWLPRTEKTPDRCPSCQSWAWNTPRTDHDTGPKPGGRDKRAVDELALVREYRRRVELGTAKVLENGTIMRLYPRTDWRTISPIMGTRYKYIAAVIGGRLIKVSLHRFIWLYFRGPIPAGMIIHHKDGNRSNCSLDNLSCLTVREHRNGHSGRRTRKPVIKPGTISDNPYIHTCLKCGHEWQSKSIKPARCPNCNVKTWNISVVEICYTI